MELAGAVENLFLQNEVEPSQLRLLAVAIGPGSFTSLRIGLALVKGFALHLACH